MLRSLAVASKCISDVPHYAMIACNLIYVTSCSEEEKYDDSII